MKTFFAVWAGLLVLLGLTVLVSALHVGSAAAEAAAGLIALAKTLLVLVFFMELRRARWAHWLVACGAVFMLGVLLAGTLDDYFSRKRDAPPQALAAPGVPSEF